MRIGLALSGGGFRATLYHLGMIRHLRDANLLTSVTHITSVSGGSVLAAHLALNWDRYCGDSQEFESAAREVIDFVKLDVRNRILRRYPFALAGSAALRLVGRKPKRPLTRTVLLEQHYRHHLFGDTCLHQLPQSPELHILCTNLSGGGLSSFTRDGLLMETRDASGRSSMRLHQVGLATVPMAVAASSAFPGFFPPLELTAETVGATPGQFQTQYFTDGGVYDNLGIRMYYHINDKLRETLQEEDFIDVAEAMEAWNQASRHQEPTPLRRVFEICSAQSNSGLDGNFTQEPGQFAHGMRRLITSGDLHLDLPLQELIHRNGNGSNGNTNGSNGHSNGSNGHSNGSNGHSNGSNGHSNGSAKDRDGRSREPYLRNRELLALAFQRTLGKEILRPRDQPFDTILASDAGKKIQVSSNTRIGGLLGTAMRSSDILMDRVWQLEQEHFRNAKGVVFSPITRKVSLEDDPTAPHPEVQQQVSHIRTDMDRFSDREISGLVRHGYCVSRRSWAEATHAADSPASNEPPWDPTSLAATRGAHLLAAAGKRGGSATPSTMEARKLQASSQRRYLSLLTAPGDWVTYLYIPVLALLFGVIPWMVWTWYHHVQINAMLSGAITQSRRDYNHLLSLLEYGPVDPWTPVGVVDASEPRALFEEQGLDIISDARIVDLRKWNIGNGNDAGNTAERQVYVCRHVSVRKLAESDGPTALRLQSLWNGEDVLVRCQNSELNPIVRRCPLPAVGNRDHYIWEVQLDFSRVAIGATVHFVVETLVLNNANNPEFNEKEWSRYEVDGHPELAAAWILLPAEKRYTSFHLVKYHHENENDAILIEPTRQSVIQHGTILNWAVVNPEPNVTYSCRWALEL